MVGGNAADTLNGGAGNDSFLYYEKAEFGDVITDFTNTSGNNDSFRFIAAAIGGNLSAGVLPSNWFRARTTNEAVDTNDRFIFRTTDKTLWFDDDGSNAHAPVMVADLQANATVTAADIILI